jgi:ribosomal-protein-alanine N-acetyltransferase
LQSKFELRGFKKDDLNNVITINQKCLPENYSNFFFIDLYKRFPETFFVAEKDGELIGYIICRIEGGSNSLRFHPFNVRKKGHIISVAVVSSHRKKGVGYALIKSSLEAMKQYYNVKECYLEVRESNTLAINLYKKSGFEIGKIMRGYYSDGENAFFMSIKLASK